MQESLKKSEEPKNNQLYTKEQFEFVCYLLSNRIGTINTGVNHSNNPHEINDNPIGADFTGWMEED